MTVILVFTHICPPVISVVSQCLCAEKRPQGASDPDVVYPRGRLPATQGDRRRGYDDDVHACLSRACRAYDPEWKPNQGLKVTAGRDPCLPSSRRAREM